MTNQKSQYIKDSYLNIPMGIFQEKDAKVVREVVHLDLYCCPEYFPKALIQVVSFFAWNPAVISPIASNSLGSYETPFMLWP